MGRKRFLAILIMCSITVSVLVGYTTAEEQLPGNGPATMEQLFAEIKISQSAETDMETTEPLPVATEIPDEAPLTEVEQAVSDMAEEPIEVDVLPVLAESESLQLTARDLTGIVGQKWMLTDENGEQIGRESGRGSVQGRV